MRPGMPASKLLLRRGAMINQRRKSGNYPLFDAFMATFDCSDQQAAAVVQLLLDNGVVVTASVLRYAVKMGTRRMNCMLMRYMAELEHLNSSIPEVHRQIIENEDFYKEYYQICLRELEKSKAAKFYNNVSIFYILTARGKTLSGYARNEELEVALENTGFNQNLFPRYFNCLKIRFSPQVEKQKSRLVAAKIISDLFVLNHPSHPVTQNILRYLTDNDLKF